MLTLLLLLALCAPSGVTGGAVGTCPAGWYAPFGSSSCYRAVSTPGTGLPWADGDAYCATQATGASLATFTNAAERAVVLVYGCGLPDSGSPGDYWVGLTDDSRLGSGSEGTWRWTPAAGAAAVASTYAWEGGGALWHSGSPGGNATENCAMATVSDPLGLTSGQVRLDDLPCSSLASVLCCQVAAPPLATVTPTPSPVWSAAAAMSVHTITYTARHFASVNTIFADATQLLATWEAAVNATYGPPYQSKWYCTTQLDVWATFNHASTCGGLRVAVASNVSTRFYLRPRDGASVASVAFAFGLDAGRGGAVLVDGAVVTFSGDDLWNSYASLTTTVSLKEGWHTVDVVSFENCCSGLTYVRGTAALDGEAPFVLEAGPAYPSPSPAPTTSPSPTATASVAATRSATATRSKLPTTSPTPTHSTTATPFASASSGALAVAGDPGASTSTAVGIIVGAALGAVLLLACGVYLLCRMRRRRKEGAAPHHPRRRRPNRSTGAEQEGRTHPALGLATDGYDDGVASSRSLALAAGLPVASGPASTRGLVNPLFALLGPGEGGRGGGGGGSGRALYGGQGARGGPAGRGGGGVAPSGVPHLRRAAAAWDDADIDGASHEEGGSARALFSGTGARGGPRGAGGQHGGSQQGTDEGIAASASGHGGSSSGGARRARYEEDDDAAHPGAADGSSGSDRQLYGGRAARGGALGRGGRPDAAAPPAPGVPPRPRRGGRPTVGDPGASDTSRLPANERSSWRRLWGGKGARGGPKAGGPRTADAPHTGGTPAPGAAASASQRSLSHAAGAGSSRSLSLAAGPPPAAAMHANPMRALVQLPHEQPRAGLARTSGGGSGRRGWEALATRGAGFSSGGAAPAFPSAGEEEGLEGDDDPTAADGGGGSAAGFGRAGSASRIRFKPALIAGASQLPPAGGFTGRAGGIPAAAAYYF